MKMKMLKWTKAAKKRIMALEPRLPNLKRDKAALEKLTHRVR